ncbi:MAG TPA: PEGA domain-containing protein [Blastocatellia bacterium]|nr:PEGA domain-containing protein [Blastocatellia bacterium]
MRLRQNVLVLALCLALVGDTYAQGNSFKEIRYQGGTLQTKVDPDDWGNCLTVTSDEIKLELKDGQTYKIDPRRVSGLSYGQEAHRRVGTMIALGILLAPLALFGLFHKTRLHFVGIEFTTEDGKKAALLLQAHKNNYRAVLVALRGATGAPIAVAPEDRKYVPANVEVLVSESHEKDGKKKAESAASNDSTTKTGSVKVTSDPSGADVNVDGAFMGNTPAQLKLSAGKHRIQITSEGFSEWSREIEVSAGSELSLTATLKKKQ